MYKTFPNEPTNVSNVWTALFLFHPYKVKSSLIFVVWSSSLYQHVNIDHKPLNPWLVSRILRTLY